MRKQLNELEVNDLTKHPVWFFTGEGEDTDELTIEPATEEEIRKDYAIIVKCIFQTSKGKEFNGYLHWQKPFTIDALQPVALVNQRIYLCFWQGMFPPDAPYIIEINKILKKDDFPIKYSTSDVFGLKKITGELEGLYYFGKNKKILIKQIG